MKKYIPALLGFLTLLALARCTVKQPKYTIATVVYATPDKLHSHTIIEYRVNNKKFCARARGIKYLVKGDRFLVVYDSLNPAHHQILFEHPVFLSEEDVHCTVGTIRRCVTGQDYTKVIYEYSVNGVAFKKLQFFRDVYHAKRGTNCLIVYHKTNPAHSRLATDFACSSGLNE